MKIVKYTYAKYGTFEVKDSNGTLAWIEFVEMRKPYEGADHEELQPIPVEDGY